MKREKHIRKNMNSTGRIGRQRQTKRPWGFQRVREVRKDEQRDGYRKHGGIWMTTVSVYVNPLEKP